MSTLKCVQGSGAHRHLGDEEQCNRRADGAAPSDLGNVGMVVWQSAFVLAELLLQHPPMGPWAHVRVVDLGSGTGAAPLADDCRYTAQRPCKHTLY